MPCDSPLIWHVLRGFCLHIKGQGVVAIVKTSLIEDDSLADGMNLRVGAALLQNEVATKDFLAGGFLF